MKVFFFWSREPPPLLARSLAAAVVLAAVFPPLILPTFCVVYLDGVPPSARASVHSSVTMQRIPERGKGLENRERERKRGELKKKKSPWLVWLEKREMARGGAGVGRACSSILFACSCRLRCVRSFGGKKKRRRKRERSAGAPSKMPQLLTLLLRHRDDAAAARGRGGRRGARGGRDGHAGAPDGGLEEGAHGCLVERVEVREEGEEREKKGSEEGAIFFFPFFSLDVRLSNKLRQKTLDDPTSLPLPFGRLHGPPRARTGLDTTAAASGARFGLRSAVEPRQKGTEKRKGKRKRHAFIVVAASSFLKTSFFSTPTSSYNTQQTPLPEGQPLDVRSGDLIYIADDLKKATEAGKKEGEGEEEEMKKDLPPLQPSSSSPSPSASSSSPPPPPPLPRSAHGETLAEASGVPSVVRYALWSLETAERVEQKEEEDEGGAKEKSSSSSSSTPPPPRSPLLLASLPPERRQLLRLLAVAHAALLETGRCWPEGEEEEEEEETGGEEEKQGRRRGTTKGAFARALALPRRFLSSLSASSSSSSSSSSFPPLFYSTLRGAAGQTEPPPRASLRVTSLGGAFALVSAGIEGAFAAAAAAAASSSNSEKNLASFPAAFSLTVKLADHFDGQGAPRTDAGEKGKKRLWQLLCDEIASPLAAAAAASRSLPPLEASLTGLPEDLLREVLRQLLLVVREGEPPQQQQQRQRRFELFVEGERGNSRSRNAVLLRLLMIQQHLRAQEARRRREERWEEKLLLFYSQEEFP